MVVKAKRLVAYYRVSTDQQGQSGLGLEAQQAAVTAYSKATGAEVLTSFTEVESGRKNDRKELSKAIRRAKSLRATLVVAKLDRLARRVSFLSTLLDSGLDVYFCDIPGSDRFTVHVLAAAAEKEAKDISDRTKAALAAYKARGGLLGGQLEQCRNLTSGARSRGNCASAKARSEKVAEHLTEILPIMRELRHQGETLQAIAAKLNGEGYRTRRGNPFTHVQVLNALKGQEK